MTAKRIANLGTGTTLAIYGAMLLPELAVLGLPLLLVGIVWAGLAMEA